MHYLHDLLNGISGHEITGAPDVIVNAIEGDSRKVSPQSAFVAISGSSFDGHTVIRNAVESGATVIIGERHVDDLDFGDGRVGHNITYVRVPDSRAIYAHMLFSFMPSIATALNDIKFIGVTGTNGKTTIATLLEQLYSAIGQTGFIGTTGIRYQTASGDVRDIEATHTTPHARPLYELIIAMHAEGVKTIVMEVSSHALEQSRVYGIPFHGAVYTNLTHDHLDYHETMEHYARAKKRLFDSLSSNSFAVVNGDDDWVLYITRDCKGRVIRVGRGSLNDVCIESETTSTSGSSYELTAPFIIHPHAVDQLNETERLRFDVPLIGAFNILNTALCGVAAMADGITPNTVRNQLSTVKGPVGRMDTMELPNGAFAIVDYAHTPDALDNVLRTLREIKESTARLHVVFGCGGNRDTSKRGVMGNIAADLADVVWVTSDNPRTEDPALIIEHIMAGCRSTTNQNVHVHADRREAIERAVANSDRGDLVLVAGKGHEQYQIIGTERVPYSDIDVIRQLSALE